MVTIKQDKYLGLKRKLLDISININTLIEMVEKERPCPKILCQINIIQKQLQELKSTLFIRQIYESTLIIQNNSKVSVQLHELAILRELFGEKI